MFFHKSIPYRFNYLVNIHISLKLKTLPGPPDFNNNEHFLYRGYTIIAHVPFDLLNELRKEIKCEPC